MPSPTNGLYAEMLRGPALRYEQQWRIYRHAMARNDTRTLTALVGTAGLDPALDAELGSSGAGDVLIAWLQRPGRSITELTGRLAGAKRVAVRRAIATLSAMPDGLYLSLAADTDLDVVTNVLANTAAPMAARTEAMRRIASRLTGVEQPARLAVHNALEADPELLEAFWETCDDVSALAQASVLTRIPGAQLRRIVELVVTRARALVSELTTTAELQALTQLTFELAEHPVEGLHELAAVPAVLTAAARGSSEADASAWPSALELRYEMLTNAHSVEDPDRLDEYVTLAVARRCRTAADQLVTNPLLTDEQLIRLADLVDHRLLVQSCAHHSAERIATLVCELPSLAKPFLDVSADPARLARHIVRRAARRKDPAIVFGAVAGHLDTSDLRELPIYELIALLDAYGPTAVRHGDAQVGSHLRGLLAEVLGALDGPGLDAFDTLAGTGPAEITLGALVDQAGAVSARPRTWAATGRRPEVCGEARTGRRKDTHEHH